MPSRSLAGHDPMGALAPGDELLYESATTRVWRSRGLVFKAYAGASAARRLRHEAGMLGRLAGVGGIVQLAAGAAPPELALALQDDGAMPLAQLLRTRRLDIGQVLAVGIAVSRALRAVHHAGIIHRDVNPANILVQTNGEVTLADFDLAVDPAPGAGGMPQGELVGTLAYLAPEQTGRTGRAVDLRADLYALGATLYEMATGRPPFAASDPLELVHEHLVREAVQPQLVDPCVPPSLAAVVMRLLAKAPEQRYQGAEGLLHDLERMRRELPGNAAFVLGERDFAARIEPGAQLAGRDGERAQLREAVETALASPRRTVLVEGPAGVGKSALVRELRPLAAASHGRFVEGKFDQFQKDAASGGWTQALRALGRLLLAQPAEALAADRARIAGRLGANADVLSSLLPEFALLLGPHPQHAEADPLQAESRLLSAVTALLGAVASPSRPLVIVLDDIQWAEALALRTFARVMEEPDLQGLVLVGVCRPVEPGTGLPEAIESWRHGDRLALHLHVANLDGPGLAAFVGGMLRLSPTGAGELAHALASLTAGNPFDTVETINALRDEGVIRLDAGGWVWDEAAIRRFAGRGTVVDLLAVRIARLPQPARLLVECLSCLGGPVEGTVLQAAMGVDVETLRVALEACVGDGLAMEDGQGGSRIVRFRHDRVQQAVLSAMQADRRARLQRDMARRLATEPMLQLHAAQQFLGCLDQVERAEAPVVAALLHEAARASLRAGNPDAALKHASAASALLGVMGDEADADLRSRVAACEHAALYGSGRLAQADAVHAGLQHGDSPALALVEPACLQMRSLYIRGRSRESLDLGLAMLARLGVQASPGFGGADPQATGAALAAWVERERGAAPARTPVQDARVLGLAKLLARSFAPACFLLDRPALAWLILEAQRLWSEHGPSASLVVALSRAPMALALLHGDYRTGYDIAMHALGVGAALGFEPETSEGSHAFAISASHWFEPLEETARRAVATRESLARHGDTSYCCFTYGITNEAARECESTLDAYAADIEEGLALCARTGNDLAATLIRLEQELLHALRGDSSPQAAGTPAGGEHGASPAAMPVVQLTGHMRRALAAAVFGDWPAVETHTERALALMDSVPGFYITLHARLLRALALAWRLRSEPAHADTAACASELADCRAWLAARAEAQPYNFLHLLRLVEAEEAWAMGDRWRAIEHFQGALDEAAVRQRPWHRALIAERAAHFQLAQGWVRSGQGLLAEALDAYRVWGAAAKAARLRDEHPFLRLHARGGGASASASASSWGDSSRMSADALDLVGVLKASQALSSETGVDRLVARLSKVLESLSGATVVKVLAEDEGRWWLLAPGEPHVPLEEAAARGRVPLSAVDYVRRTGETLVLDDAPADDRFAADPYFAGIPHCSLVAVPVAGQGSASAVLLLENRQQRAAFNASRLDAVMLIAGQLAVSLANSRLYERLEERVRSRTREIEQMQTRLVDTARRAGKAEVANNVLHNVGNVLNSINVSASVARRLVGDSRSGGLARAVALLNENANDLAAFFGDTGRGGAMLAYLGELSAALAAEREAALAELDRLAQSVEHITYVVATQQSWAGPSSVVETVQPAEVIEEALHLAADAIGSAGVRLVREFEPMRPAVLDRQRLLQVLVNLVVNASQAMQAGGADTRRLTVACAAVPASDGETLRIDVRDEGEGISRENLERIFSHGFTTRAGGHGFGLHSSAVAAMEMGGKLTARSDGPGRGAVFTLTLPIEPPPPAPGLAPPAAPR